MHGATYPYVIKNQRKARKPLVGGFGCLELVLYGIRELAQHHYELLGNDLDIEWTTLIAHKVLILLYLQKYIIIFAGYVNVNVKLCNSDDFHLYVYQNPGFM